MCNLFIDNKASVEEDDEEDKEDKDENEEDDEEDVNRRCVSVEDTLTTYFTLICLIA